MFPFSLFTGYLYDATGDYNVAFYFAGTAFALTVILVYLARVLKDRIISKLYAKFLHKKEGESSTNKLKDFEIASTEEYDNPAFVEDHKTKDAPVHIDIPSNNSRGEGNIAFEIRSDCKLKVED